MEKQDSSPLNFANKNGEEEDKASSESLAVAESKPQRMRLLFLTLIFLLAFWIIIGVLSWPRWWADLLFEGEWRSLTNWWGGFSTLLQAYGIPGLLNLITVLAILWLSRTSYPDKLHTATQNLWNGRISFKKMTSILVGVITLVGGIIFFAEFSTRSDRKEHAEAMQRLNESNKNLTASLEKLKAEISPPLLLQPTKFIFLNKDTVESLYGQYEPELVPTVVTIEIKKSEELKGELSIENFLKTQYGREVYNSRIEQYQKTTKNTERKLKDFLTYFAEKNHENIFRGLQRKSENITKLEEATQLFLKYDSTVFDQRKLQEIRDRELATVVEKMKESLQNIHGLVFIEGNWTVEVKTDSNFLLKSPFIEAVSNSPICEISLSKDSLAPQDKEILANSPGKRLHLSVFGNALSGITEGSKIIAVSPIAIF